MKKSKKSPGWFQLIENKTVFKKILHSLNKYYAILEEKKSLCQEFREEVVRTDNENLEIFIKRFGEYEYFVGVKIYTPKGSKFESWIHIDGIYEERKIMKDINSNHAVFSIPAMTDIFEKNCKPVNFDLNIAI
jgi:hypothetical protein